MSVFTVLQDMSNFRRCSSTKGESCKELMNLLALLILRLTNAVSSMSKASILPYACPGSSQGGGLIVWRVYVHACVCDQYSKGKGYRYSSAFVCKVEMKDSVLAVQVHYLKS